MVKVYVVGKSIHQKGIKLEKNCNWLDLNPHPTQYSNHNNFREVLCQLSCLSCG